MFLILHSLLTHEKFLKHKKNILQYSKIFYNKRFLKNTTFYFF